MVEQTSIQSYIAKKMSALRILENKGKEEALRVYPELNLLILGLEGLGVEQLQILRQSLIVELQSFKDA